MGGAGAALLLPCCFSTDVVDNLRLGTRGGPTRTETPAWPTRVVLLQPGVPLPPLSTPADAPQTY